MDLDDTDRALIGALLEDGRASIQELAAEAGVTVDVAERRIDSLEDAGVIEGYTATVDDAALGYDVIAVVRIRVRGSTAVVAEMLGEYLWTRSVYEVTGEHDFILVGRFRDTEDMHESIAELLTEPTIGSATVDVVLDAVRTCEPISLVGSID
jgi:Lrp/AsnC family leucine-responsive transcriptional regulator